MRSVFRSYSAYFLTAALLGLLLLFPAEAAEGARQGLSVCAGVIVPSLFPFLVLSSLLSALRLPWLLAAHLRPVLRFLGLPPLGAAPFLLGLCGGYPLGARAVAELVREGALDPEEGAALLPVCNNTGPGFIIGVMGSAVFGSAKIGALLYLSHILAALTLARLSLRSRSRMLPAPPERAAAFSALFPASVSAAAAAALDVSAYVVFFSVLTSVARRAGVFSAAAGFLARCFGADARFFTALFTGLLELGSGAAALRGMTPSPASLALSAFLLGFGGVSVHAQTLAAVAGTKVRCARHFAGRILHGIFSAVYVVLIAALLTRLRI